MKFRQSLLSYAEKHEVTQAAIKYNVNKGIRITGAACNNQFFICLDILEGLNQISNALFRHQTTKE